MLSLFTNNEAKSTKKSETSLTNVENLVAIISRGHSKFMFMICGNFNDSSSSWSTHDMAAVEGA